MITRALGTLAAACLGAGLARSVQDLSPEVPAGWSLGQPPAPVLWAGLAGELAPSPGALDLAAFATARPDLPGFALGALAVDARVPRDGLLVVRFSDDLAAGPRPPRAADVGHPLAPGQIPAFMEGVTLVIDRGPRAEVRAHGLDCGPLSAPGERFHLEVAAAPDGLEVRLDDAVPARCAGALPPGVPTLGSGLRRVQVEAATYASADGRVLTWRFGGPWRGPAPRWLVALGFGLAFALGAPAVGGAGRRRWLRPTWRGLALAGLPLLAWPLLSARDPVLLAQSLRLLYLPPALVVPSLLLPLFAALGVAALAWHARLRSALVAVAVGTGALLFGLALGGWPPDAPGLLALAAAGVPVALLAWVNRQGLRGTSLLSLGLCALLCAWAEVGLRLTRLGEDWDVGALQARAERALDALTVERRHRDYPDEGYPVRPPDPRPGVRRVVALGSSSTGGAFQMDDLGLFWPARLGERLGPRGWEVVNQGVGGWNSLHVRLYLEQQVDALAPDLVVVYLGHNDLEPSALTARQSWERYRDRRAWTLALARSRAFTGLRLTLQALVGREGTCAVPPADARENLAAIVRAANDRGARVLLVTEGLDPDPAPMAGYGALMRDLAAGTGNRWLDGAGALHALGSPDLFIDDCHLSAQGHEVLAGLVEAALDEAGWLGPAGGAP